MAVAMSINSETVKDGLQYLGDVVGIFPDDHVFSGTEQVKFDFLTINGTVVDVRRRIQEITPIIKTCYLWESDNKYHWTEADGETTIGTIEVYQISNKWFEAVNDFKFPVNVGELTATEKQFLETVDILSPSVDAYIQKLIKDIAALSDNDFEIRELRNTSP